MKQVLLTLVCVSVLASPGFAQTSGRKALDDWITSYRSLGVDITYDAIDETIDGLTVRNLKGGYRTTIVLPEKDPPSDGPFPPGEISIEISMAAPTVVFTAVSEDDNGYSAGKVLCEMGCGTQIQVRLDGGPPISLDWTMSNYRTSDLFEPKYPAGSAGSSGSLADWLPVLRLWKKVRIGESSADRIAGAFEIPKLIPDMDAVSGSFVRNGFRIAGWQGGRIAEYSEGPQESKVTVHADDQDIVQKSRTEGVTATGVNYGALIDLIDPENAATGKYVNVVETASVEGFRMDSPEANAAIESYGIEGLAVRDLGVDLIALAENLPEDPDRDPSGFFGFFLELYRLFSIDRLVIDNWTVMSQDPVNPVDFTIGQLLLSRLSAEGLGEFSITGLVVRAEGDNSFKSDRIFVGDVVFPPYGPVKAFIDNPAGWDIVDPFEVARIFTPHSFTMSMDGLTAEGSGFPGRFALDRYSLAMKSSVPPIPTALDYVVSGLDFPVAAMDDEDAEAIFTALGMQSLQHAEQLKLYWDEQSSDVVLDSLVFEIGGFARVEARMRLGGIPRFLLEDPTQFEAAIVTANVKSGWIRITDLGGVNKVIRLRATNTGVDERDVHDLLLGQVSDALRPLNNDEFTERVTEAVNVFLKNRGTLTVTISPERPVPVAQVAAGIMQAPQALPDLLGIEVENGQ